MTLDPVHVRVAQLLVSFAFASAALHKLRAPQAFGAIVRDYRLLPARLAPAAAVFLIALEVAVAVGIWLPPLRATLSAGGAFLLCVYAGAIATNLARGRREIDCGCTWGRSKQPLSAWLLLRNALLVCVCLLAGLTVQPRSLGFPDAGLIALAGLSFALCYRAFETLLAQQPGIRELRG